MERGGDLGMEFTGLEAKDIVAGYSQGENILRGVSLQLAAGERVALIGPNGSGKSTLLKVLAGGLHPVSGEVTLNGRQLYKMKDRQRALQLTRVPQNPRLQLPFTVLQYVSMGRYPYQRWGRRLDANDLQMVANALQWTGLEDKVDQPLSMLSGGERQRAALAQALAQDVRCLLLDEPNAALDLRHQLALLEILHQRSLSSAMTVLAVLHDINLAARFADRIYLLSGGGIYAEGTPDEVLTEDNMRVVYGVRVVRVYTPDGKSQYIPMQPVEAKVSLSHRIHLIGGGGSAGLLMLELYRAGYHLSLGMVQRGDTDLQVAENLGIPAVSMPVMDRWESDDYERLSCFIDEADGIVIADTWFGRGNMENLRVALKAQAEGIPVWLVEETPFMKKDFTDGAARALRDTLIARGAVSLAKPAELLETIDQYFGVKRKSESMP